MRLRSQVLVAAAICVAVSTLHVASAWCLAQPFTRWERLVATLGPDGVFGVAVDAADNVVVAGAFSNTINLGGDDLESAGSTDVLVAKFTRDGQHVWSIRLGGSLGEQARRVAINDANEIIVFGAMKEGLDLGGGPLPFLGGFWDIFVLKLDADGNHIWSHGFGGAGDEFSWSIACDSIGNVFIAGQFQGTIDFGGVPLVSPGTGTTAGFVTKLSGNGAHVWSKRLGTGRHVITRSLALDPDDNVTVTGEFLDAIDLGGGPITSVAGLDVFLVKYTNDGNHIWSRGIGSISSDRVRGIAADAAGNLFITGETGAGSDFGEGPNGVSGLFLAKYDGNGHYLWVRQSVASPAGVGGGVATDAAGNVCVTGYTWGPIDLGGGIEGDFPDVIAAKYTSGGDYVWSTPIPGAFTAGALFGVDSGRGVAANSQGQFIAVGVGGASGSAGGQNDGFIRSLQDPIPLPVLLQEYDARWVTNRVEVSWRLAQIEGDLTFRLYRAGGSSPHAQLRDRRVERTGDSFIFADYEVAPGNAYRYTVEIYENNRLTTSFETAATTPAIVATLGQNYPNPFNPSTTIPFAMEASGHITLQIFDASGALVRTLFDHEMPAGHNAVEWDGRNSEGVRVVSGLYYYQLKTGSLVTSRRAVLLK